MELVLLSNLARTRVFDAGLKSGSMIDRLAARYLDTAMFNPRPRARAVAIAELEAAIVLHFEGNVEPAAQRTGVQNARTVIDAMPAADRAAALADPDVRRLILIDGPGRTSDRLRIVQALVNDRANTLVNRLTAYWLEPGLGERAKLQQLRQIHADMDAAQKRYGEQMAAHAKGEAARPRKPNLEYMPRFQADVKKDLREQARRRGAEAETAEFAARGLTRLTWVTVQASDACPDCRVLNGLTLDVKEWERKGRPGSGNTVCGQSCYCMLVPEAAANANQSLKVNGLVVPRPVLLPEDLAKLAGAA
ncbi:MAG TPA: hypothetical protein VK324_06675 [Tepidisphaeraceae bacterium]|nr:hypothetical protein [Tepidisphaeraceae bacterium]